MAILTQASLRTRQRINNWDSKIYASRETWNWYRDGVVWNNPFQGTLPRNSSSAMIDKLLINYHARGPIIGLRTDRVSRSSRNQRPIDIKQAQFTMQLHIPGRHDHSRQRANFRIVPIIPRIEISYVSSKSLGPSGQRPQISSLLYSKSRI